MRILKLFKQSTTQKAVALENVGVDQYERQQIERCYVKNSFQKTKSDII